MLNASFVYDENIMKLEAIAYPKIVFADQNISDKLVDNTIVITILYDELDILAAKQFKRYIDNEYTKLGNYDINITLQAYTQLSSDQPLSSAYICLLSKPQTIKRVSIFLNQNARITFAYAESELDYGVLMGLTIRATTQLIINHQSLKDSRIVLDEHLFKVAKLR